MTAVAPTQDGMGYYVVVGNRRAFVSSYHLVPDKEAQLKKLNKEDNMRPQEDNSCESTGSQTEHLRRAMRYWGGN